MRKNNNYNKQRWLSEKKFGKICCQQSKIDWIYIQNREHTTQNLIENRMNQMVDTNWTNGNNRNFISSETNVNLWHDQRIVCCGNKTVNILFFGRFYFLHIVHKLHIVVSVNWVKIRRDYFIYRTFAKCVSAMNEAITSLPPSQNNQEYLVNQNQSLNLSETIFQVYHQAVSHSVEALEHILFFLGLYAIVCLIVYLLIFRKWTAQWYRNATNVRFPQSKRALIVIAHPDDESMFFGPTIISLVKRNCQVFLLCLSNGSYSFFCCKLWNILSTQYFIASFCGRQYKSVLLTWNLYFLDVERYI